MPAIDALISEAEISAATQDSLRAMEICNACRYCEGYCAVFPAMALQRDFAVADMDYFANLCHNCNGCYHACQFAPPHPFGINLPQSFAEVRLESYEAHAWPGFMGPALRRNFVVLAPVTAGIVALVFALMLALIPGETLFGVNTGPGAFYRLVPWAVMSAVAAASLGFSSLALVMSARHFWASTRSALAQPITTQALRTALIDAATLRYLGGGGEGCNDLNQSFSNLRRHLHHTLAYGFVLCLASTSVATVFHHLLGWEAPYSLHSLPVILGTLGGIGMVVGAGGLIWVKIATDPAPVARRVLGAEYLQLVLLAKVAGSGLLLLALRDTGAMGVLLAAHLGLVLAFFVTLPYGKMLHAPLRFVALLKAAAERLGRAAISG